MNGDLNFFRLADPQESDDEPEEFDDSCCACKNPSDQFLVWIEDGGIYLRHKDCGKPPPASWDDWQDGVAMPEFQARVTWARQRCTCNLMLQNTCDCGDWLNIEFTEKI